MSNNKYNNINQYINITGLTAFWEAAREWIEKLIRSNINDEVTARQNADNALEERVDSLEADRIKSVTKGTSTENYLTLGVSTTDLNTTITIDDTPLKEKIEEIDGEMDTFVKSESIPIKLPNPQPLAVQWTDKKNQTQQVIYDGSEESQVDLTEGIYYATTSTTATRVSNYLTIEDKDGRDMTYNGSDPEFIDSIKYAGDADKLGGQLPSYYAKNSELVELSETVSSIDARVTTNTTNISDEVTARQNADNALDERLDAIESSYVKSVKVIGTNGITATPTTTTIGEVSISISGQELKESIEALGKVVNLTGVYAAGTELNTINGNDGDFIIVGQKEYVYWGNATTGVDGTNWVLLGDTTQLSQNVSNLTNSYTNHTHTFTGDLNTTSDTSLTISYNSGKLNINTLHNHTVTPTGEISKPSIKQETSTIDVVTSETSINILSNVDTTEDSITMTGDNITIENNENNYNLIIE